MSISRRNFLKLTLTSIASSGFFYVKRATAATSNTLTADVIVIGAGIAGLAAAAKIQSSGKRVIVLEAQRTIGGRIITDRTLSVPLDLGASWIHGVNKNPINTLATTLKLNKVATDYNSIQRYDFDGRPITDAEDSLVDSNYSALMSKVSKIQRTAKTDQVLGTSIANIISTKQYSSFEQRALQYSINTEIEHDYAADINNLSLKNWDQDSEFSGNDVLLPQGYDQIVNYLSTNLDIRLSTIVNQIDYRASTVSIQTSNGVFTAPKVIVTIPLGVLKTNAVTFTPSLPSAHNTAINRIGMGVLNKLYLLFPKVFWEPQKQLLGYIGQQKGYWGEWYNYQYYIGKPILLGFNAASYARTVEAYTDAQTISEAMSVLKTIYGNSIPNPTGYKLTRWAKNPWSFGSYSYMATGASGADCDALTVPINNKLFFAGEHTNKQYLGTVHGAYLSGLRVSSKV
jgi:monoamine oxidase